MCIIHFLSTLQVISCPLQTLSGGPVVSLEAATSPQSLVIVWPIFCDPNTADIVSYSVIINDQPFGEQVNTKFKFFPCEHASPHAYRMTYSTVFQIERIRVRLVL